MQLSSAKNPLLQSVRKASALGRRTADGLIVAEGPHLLEEALRSRWKVAQVLVTPEARQRYAEILRHVDGEVIEVSARALAATAATETTQEVISTIEPHAWTWSDLTGPDSAEPDLAESTALVVALDGIQDPGNAGTIVRSAEAFGATGVVLLTGSVRIANAKFIRATAGSIFRLPLLEQVTVSDFVGTAQTMGLRLYALTADGRTPLPEAGFRDACALVVGSEGAGVSAALLSACETVSIPTVKVESLNAAIASSIALFEASRQRSSA